MVTDLKSAVRMLAKAPAFTVVIVLVVGLCLGLTTAALALGYEIFVRPLPFFAQNRLAIFCCPFPQQGQGWNDAPASPAAIRDYARAARSPEMVSIYYDQHNLNLTNNASDNGSQHLPVTFVDSNYFPLLGTSPAFGRYFTADECAEGSAYPVAVVSYAFWKNQLGGRQDGVGTSIKLNGNPYTIIGIMPEHFRDLSTEGVSPELWLPLPMATPYLGEHFWSNYSLHTFRAAVRLKRDVSFSTAQLEADAIARQIESAQPKTHHGRTIRLMPIREFFFLNTRQPVLVLFFGALLVLLLGAVNLANLFTVNGLKRAHEFALRTALGADSKSLSCTVLLEAFAPMLFGGLVGFGFATGLVELFNRASTLALPDFSEIRLSLAVILTALGLLCSVVLVAALAPVVRARRFDLHFALQTGSKGTSAPGSARARHLLIAAEVALATALLFGTGLTARSLFQMTKMKTGYNPHRLLTFRLQLDRARLPTREQRIDFARRLAAAFQNGPGLEAATLWGPSMLSHAGWTVDVTPAGRDLSDPASTLNVQLLQTIPAGMASLGISLLRGRDFSSSPPSEYPLETIIDEEAAHRLWPGLDPIGQTMFLSNDRNRPATVIGLAPHVLNRGRTFDDAKYLTGDIYLSFYQMPQERITVVMRYHAGQEESILRWTRAELARLDPDLAPFDVATMDERMTRESRGPRFTATVFAVYSAVALLVTVVGVYGVLAFSIGQRTREFGLRFAVGASRTQVLRLVLAQSAKWISLGVVAGLIIALQCVPLLDQLLIGVSPRDPFILIGTIGVILAAGLLATLVPALRAARVDPLVALRCE